MAGTKRKSGGKSTAGQGYKKRRGIGRFRTKVPRAPRGTILNVRRMVISASPMTVSTTTGVYGYWRYQTVSLDNGFQQFNVDGTALTSLTNKAEYQALFDEYKLSAYKVTLIPKFANYSTSQDAALGTTLIPYICIVKDPQSKLVPTGLWSGATLNILLENGGKIYRADRPVNIYMKPKVTEQYGGGADRYVSPKFTDLSSSAGTTMPHRGFHIFVFVGTWVAASMVGLAWDVRTTYYLKFKNHR